MGDDVSRRRWQHHTRVWNFALTYASYTFQFPHTFWSEDLRSCLLSNKGHRHLSKANVHREITSSSIMRVWIWVKLQSTLISSMYVYHPHPNHSAQLWRSCVAELLVLTYIPNRLCALGPPSFSCDQNSKILWLFVVLYILGKWLLKQSLIQKYPSLKFYLFKLQFDPIKGEILALTGHF